MQAPRRKPTRLANYDYGEPGRYFVTICLQQRLPLLGEVNENAVLRLSEAGLMIDRAWKEIALCHPDVTTDVHIVMPDHVHGIIMIGTNDLPRHAALSQVIQWFKTVTVKRYGEGVRKLGWQPYKGQLWQRSFHDHIIRNDHEFKNRHEYIEANPWRWVESRDAARNLP